MGPYIMNNYDRFIVRGIYEVHGEMGDGHPEIIEAKRKKENLSYQLGRQRELTKIGPSNVWN